jgi:Fur family transcriptional regulator, ferric uptake regulator
MKVHDCHKDFFHQHHLKNTPARDLVYHLLDSHQPITLDKLYTLVNKTNKKAPLSHSTIYRMLIQFEQAGIVEKLMLQTETTPLFQLKLNHHHHQLVCTQCKEIIEVEDCPSGDVEKILAKKHHFLIHHHQFTLYGLCQHCQAKSQ